MINFSRQQQRFKARQEQIAVEEEDFLPGSIFFNSHHSALQAVLETLGTKNTLVPVILSINASPQTLAAVLHAGGAPVLVDIEKETLQMNPAEVEYISSEFKNSAILIADRPAAAPVNPVLFEVAKGKLPVVVDSYHTPTVTEREQSPGDFCIYEMDRPLTVVVHKYKEQQKKLRDLRDGLLGHWSWPCLPVEFAESWITAPDEVRAVYTNQLKLALPTEKFSSYAVAEVFDAKRYYTYLRDCGIETFLAVSPLHLFSEVRGRFARTDNPSYPVAEQLSQTLLALPVDITEDEAREVCLRIKEIKR